MLSPFSTASLKNRYCVWRSIIDYNRRGKKRQCTGDDATLLRTLQDSNENDRQRPLISFYPIKEGPLYYQTIAKYMTLRIPWESTLATHLLMAISHMKLKVPLSISDLLLRTTTSSFAEKALFNSSLVQI